MGEFRIWAPPGTESQAPLRIPLAQPAVPRPRPVVRIHGSDLGSVRGAQHLIPWPCPYLGNSPKVLLVGVRGSGAWFAPRNHFGHWLFVTVCHQSDGADCPGSGGPATPPIRQPACCGNLDVPMGSSRVVHVGPSVSAHGGIARMIAALVSSDLGDCYQLEAIGTSSGRRGVARLATFPAALARLLWIFVRRRPAGVHVHTASWNSFPRKRVVVALAHSMRIPVILQIHGGGFLDYIGERRSRERAVRRVLHSCAAVILLSEALREPLAAIAPECSVWVIPNAVDIPAAPTRGMDSGRVVFAGRPVAEKGIPELLCASRALAARVPSFRLVIAGDDVDRRLAEQIGGSLLETRVDLCGWLDHEGLDRVYANSSVFVLPSHVEAMPVALLEAMSHGLACVVTPVGAIPQIISDGANGVIVPVADAKALEESIGLLLANHDLRRRLGAHARSTIEEHYSMAGAVGQIREVYAACGIDPLCANPKEGRA